MASIIETGGQVQCKVPMLLQGWECLLSRAEDASFHGATLQSTQGVFAQPSARAARTHQGPFMTASISVMGMDYIPPYISVKYQCSEGTAALTVLL